VPPFKRPVTHAIHGPRFGNGCLACLPAITSKAGESSSRPSSTGIRLISCNPIPPSQQCWARGFVSVFLITSTTLIKGYSASYQRPHVRCCPLVLRVKIGPLEESYLGEAGNCWVRVEKKELAAKVAVNDTGNLYLYAYYKGMRQRGADRLVIKEHQAWRIADFFLRQFPHAKIVVQVRDPRDHAVSCKKLGHLYAAYHGSVARAARMWSMDQHGALQLRAKYGVDKVRINRYEDLVLRPRETLQGICEFLQLD
jgi:hypothetical protein